MWLRLTGCPQHPSGWMGPGATSTGVGPGQVSFGLVFCTTKSLRNLPRDDWSLPCCSPLTEGPTVKAWAHVCPHRHTRAHTRWVPGSLHVGPRLRGWSFALGAPPGLQSWSDPLWTTCSWQRGVQGEDSGSRPQHRTGGPGALLGHTCPQLQAPGGPRHAEKTQDGERAQVPPTLMTQQLASPLAG